MCFYVALFYFVLFFGFRFKKLTHCVIHSLPYQLRNPHLKLSCSPNVQALETAPVGFLFEAMWRLCSPWSICAQQWKCDSSDFTVLDEQSSQESTKGNRLVTAEKLGGRCKYIPWKKHNPNPNLQLGRKVQMLVLKHEVLSMAEASQTLKSVNEAKTGLHSKRLSLIKIWRMFKGTWGLYCLPLIVYFGLMFYVGQSSVSSHGSNILC